MADNHRVNSFLTVCVKRYGATGHLVDDLYKTISFTQARFVHSLFIYLYGGFSTSFSDTKRGKNRR